MLVISGAVSLTLIPTGVVCSNSDDLQLPECLPVGFSGQKQEMSSSEMLGQGAWCRRTCMERYPDMCPWTGSKELFVTGNPTVDVEKKTHTPYFTYIIYPQFGWGHISKTNSAATPEVDHLAKLMYKTPRRKEWDKLPNLNW